MPSSSSFESSDNDSQAGESSHDGADEKAVSLWESEASDIEAVSQHDGNEDDEEDLSPAFEGSDNDTSTGSNYTSEIERAESLLRLSSSQGSPDRDAHIITSLSSSEASGRNPPNEQALRVNFTKRALEQYVQLWKDLQDRSSIVHQPLEEGYVGNSFWTTAEKQMFFTSLARHGKRAIDRMSNDIGSKSVLEVRQYVLMLKYTPAEIAPDRTEAAYEISGSLEELLDQFADRVEANQLDRACAADREQFGDLWILDGSYVGEVEDAILETPGTSDETKDSEWDERSRPAEDESALTSLDILRPSKLIELMQNVFMNASKPIEDNWQHMTILTIDSEGPSILRSAFEDLHLTVIELVKKLVPAILMQATSRLRSIRDATVAHNVRAGDVAAALQVLGLPQRLSDTYWLSAINQRSINVYSRSDQFKQDGSVSSRLGYRLTKDQLERCLLATDETMDNNVRQETSLSEKSMSAAGESAGTTSSQQDSLPEDFSDESEVRDVDQDSEGADLEFLKELAVEIEAQDAVLATKDENFLRDRLDLPHLEADVLIKHEKRPNRQIFSLAEQWPAGEGGYIADWELSNRKKRRVVSAGRRRRSRSALIHFASADSDTDVDGNDSEPDEQDSAEMSS